MKKIISLVFLISLLFSFLARAQSDSLAVKQKKTIKSGFQIYPLQQQIGWRGNLTKKSFWDFKGGLTLSELPFFVLELNYCRRFVNRSNVKVYWGGGITFDSYVPGIQIPFGIEFCPLQTLEQLTIIAEVSPKMSFGPVNFMNIAFSPHTGLCYYMKYNHIKIRR